MKQSEKSLFSINLLGIFSLSMNTQSPYTLNNRPSIYRPIN
jgi:hypothetical protein